MPITPVITHHLQHAWPMGIGYRFTSSPIHFQIQSQLQLTPLRPEIRENFVIRNDKPIYIMIIGLKIGNMSHRRIHHLCYPSAIAPPAIISICTYKKGDPYKYSYNSYKNMQNAYLTIDSFKLHHINWHGPHTEFEDKRLKSEDKHYN